MNVKFSYNNAGSIAIDIFEINGKRFYSFYTKGELGGCKITLKQLVRSLEKTFGTIRIMLEEKYYLLLAMDENENRTMNANTK